MEPPVDFQPACTVVVCTRNRPKELERCLEGVAGLLYPRFEVLVVDSGPVDNQTREVATKRNLRYMAEPMPGQNRARNRGARATDAEIVAYLDDDAVPEPQWISALVEEFRDPQVMVVTGRILPLRVETEAERLFAALGGFDVGDQKRRVLDRRTPRWFEIANFGGIGNGSSMAFRRSAFEKWPGFDERLGPGTGGPGGDEHYAFFSLVKVGYRVVHTPKAVVRHPYPRSLPELRARYLKALAAATGYMTFLFFEEPRFRWATVKYVAQALRGARRPWRKPAPARLPRVVSGWRKLIACLSGPLLYGRTCLTNPLSRNRA